MAQKTRILAFDIEASNLSADFGMVLTFGYKTVEEGRVRVLNLHNYLDQAHGDPILAERFLLEEASRVMMGADIWLTHFGSRGLYDMNFIQTRLLYHRLPTLPPMFPHIDTWKVSKQNLKLSSNRLATLSTFLETSEEKNKIKPEQWIRALTGDKRSMGYIVEHNRRDVEVLEEVYILLRPLIHDHPSMRGACGVCGKGPLQQRGFRITRTRRYRRFQCQACGSWSQSKTFEVLR